MPKQVEHRREGLGGTLTVENGPEVTGYAVLLDGEVVREEFSSKGAAVGFLEGFREGWRHNREADTL